MSQTGSQFMFENDLELLTLLPIPPLYWVFKCALPRSLWSLQCWVQNSGIPMCWANILTTKPFAKPDPNFIEGMKRVIFFYFLRLAELVFAHCHLQQIFAE